jgi:hypothetical protein
MTRPPTDKLYADEKGSFFYHPTITCSGVYLK